MSAVTLDALPSDLEAVRTLLPEPPLTAIVLGSGLGAIARGLERARELSYDKIEGMRPPTAVPGHAGRLVAGTVAGRGVLVFQGRLHTYQGVTALDAAYPARLAAGAGARILIVTNASGSVSPHLPPGALMLLADHVNLLGDNPLRGWPGPVGGVAFVSMARAYDAELREIAHAAASTIGITLAEGIYGALPGPTFETPAEVQALRTLGIDAVGMSTVPEVIVARALGLRVLGLSLVTNRAGASDASHEEVLKAGQAAQDTFKQLLFGILAALRVP
jgi:purine-nucleoside phosphorylase